MITFIYLALGLGIAFALIYIFGVHKALLTWLPYRWLINSILFPYTYYSVKRKLKNKTAYQKTYYLTENYWFKKYWFGRKITKLVNNSFIILLLVLSSCTKMDVHPEFDINKDIIHFETNSECTIIVNIDSQIIILNGSGYGWSDYIQVDKGKTIDVILNTHEDTQLSIYSNERYKARVYAYSLISFSMRADNGLIEMFDY